MKDISLHILDVAQNSIAAGATRVEISVREKPWLDELEITIEDNGNGMTDEALSRVEDPFYTTRTTRRVGLGIPLLKHSAEQAGGSFAIRSVPGKGTRLVSVFGRSHIDRPPMGDIAGVISSLAGMNPGMDFIYRHAGPRNTGEYVFDTREAKAILGDIPLSEPAVILYLKEMIEANI
jgi:anti-sigma regulatory factor (Ser/Thr protein kinase)